MSDAIDAINEKLAEQSVQLTTLKTTVDAKQEVIAATFAALQAEIADLKLNNFPTERLAAIAATLVEHNTLLGDVNTDVEETAVPESSSSEEPA